MASGSGGSCGKAGSGNSTARNQRFKRRAELSTNHLHDFQGWVLGEVGARLAAQGLDPAQVGPIPVGSSGPAEAPR